MIGVIEQVAVRVEHGDLAAGSESGVDGQHDLLGDRRLEQQAAEVPGEDLDGVLLGGLGEVAADLALHAGQDQPVQGVDGRGAEDLAPGDGPPGGAGGRTRPRARAEGPRA